MIEKTVDMTVHSMAGDMADSKVVILAVMKVCNWVLQKAVK